MNEGARNVVDGPDDRDRDCRPNSSRAFHRSLEKSLGRGEAMRECGYDRDPVRYRGGSQTFNELLAISPPHHLSIVCLSWARR